MKICGTCKKTKSLEEFALKDKQKGKYQSYCRDCQRVYRQKHYQSNKKKYIVKAAIWRAKHREEFYQWLLQQNCLDCGNSDIRVLEFDHVRGEKEKDIARLIGNVSFTVLKKELDKCDIVCANCHRIRTAIQFNQSRQVLYNE